MTATTIRVQMAQRKDTAANWTAANPILLSGEIGYETDTKKFKIGNGSSNWNTLTYLPIPDGSGNLTITGNLEIGTTGSLTFEGSTANAFETTLAVTDPTADRTITLPDRSGTVITSGDTGTVTSTMLVDGTIVNADISATAEIAVSKLANGTANQVLVTDGTDVSWSDNLTLAGNLTVNGTTTTIDSQTLLVEDKNIEMGVVATPTDVTADGGGITLRGTTNKTINWIDSTDSWTSSEHFDLASGKSYRINNTVVLSSTTLGTGVTGSSLTSVGTIGTGVWQGTAINATYLDATLVKTSDTGTVTSTMIADGTIVNADVSASAAIAGTKISPDFGSQNRTSTGTSTAASFIPTSSTAPTNGLYLSAANSVALSANGSERLRITSTGQLSHIGAGSSGSPAVSFSGSAASNSLVVDSSSRVGIGTSAPNRRLQISDSNADNFIRVNTSGAFKSGIEFSNLGTAFGQLYFNNVAPYDLSLLQQYTTGSLILGTNNTERARIDSSGRLGIGTASPVTALDVTGAIRSTNGTIDARLHAGYSGAVGIGAQSNDPVLFIQNGTERARIDGSGRILVGTSSRLSSQSGLVEFNGSAGIASYINNAFANSFVLSKSRGTTQGTIVQPDDEIGFIRFAADDGTTTPRIAVQIGGFVDGTPGASDMPGRLVFSTTADGAASPTERLRITSAGVLQVADAGNIAVGTTTGTKIGTATTQKLGFFNKTPVVQPAAVADATDAASVITQLNALLARMRDLGLIAT